MSWNVEHFDHLLWYLNAEPRPKGLLESKLGEKYSPIALCPSSSGDGTKGFPLDALIDYLEKEIKEKDLHRRAALERQGVPLEDVVAGYGMRGMEALDAYISALIGAVRDFPYHKLNGGQEAGAWVRDEVVAPVFKGHWRFYSNQKARGFTLEGLLAVLSEDKERSLLGRLRIAKLAGGF
mmetsp:Transcript_19243/g.34854  ORF Transcript_19243/g.34854 Transcript_19243/m.34854 type:complete len:180 (-) Transcript_19243:89-628(-)